MGRLAVPNSGLAEVILIGESDRFEVYKLGIDSKKNMKKIYINFVRYVI
jgi:hypothetical protein